MAPPAEADRKFQALRTQWRKELGSDAPALGAAELACLLETVRKAKRSQKTALQSAIDEGMSFVPALLRIPLRRILFP